MSCVERYAVGYLEISCSEDVSRQAVVCSHERSGTHFLMNALTLNSAYTNVPLVNFDVMSLGPAVNFSYSENIHKFMGFLAERRCSSLIKTHHSAEFFQTPDGELAVGDSARVFYLVRDPVDVMLSFQRFVDHHPWHEGPACEDITAFMTARPEGNMLRYQFRQQATVLDRWKTHVLGWLDLAARSPNVMIVPYRVLDEVYETQMQQVLGFVDQASPEHPVRPDPINFTVYVPGKQTLPAEERARLRAFVKQRLDTDALDRFII